MLRPTLLSLTIVSAILAACPREKGDPSGVRRVILDLDAGGDDAWALLMLAMNEIEFNVCIQAVTCSHGNTDIDNVAINIARILEALGRSDIPVYKGARERLITPAPPRDASRYFWGLDGFGDVEFSNQPDMSVVQSDEAVPKMNDLLNKYPNEITIVSVGPLTNLALLFKIFPESKQYIADIYILGGNRHGVGNTEFVAEFNFFTDPEAANIVINNAPVVVNIFPWESILALEHAFTTKWRFETFRYPKNAPIQLLNVVESDIFANLSGWSPCDMYPVAVFLNNSLVIDSVPYKADVELNGKVTRGMLAIFHHVHEETEFNVNIIDEVDVDMLMKMVAGLNRVTTVSNTKDPRSRMLVNASK